MLQIELKNRIRFILDVIIIILLGITRIIASVLLAVGFSTNVYRQDRSINIYTVVCSHKAGGQVFLCEANHKF